MKQDIFKLSFSDEEGSVAEFKNTDDVVMTLSDWVTAALEKKDQEPISILFSAVVHTLAREASGKFEGQFIDNLRKVTSQYRESYRKAAMLQKVPEFSLVSKKDAYKS